MTRMPQACASRGSRNARSELSTVMLPWSGMCTPSSRRISVDFPAPFSPTSPTISPGLKPSDTSCNAWTTPNALASPSTLTISVVPVGCIMYSWERRPEGRRREDYLSLRAELWFVIGGEVRRRDELGVAERLHRQRRTLLDRGQQLLDRD